MFVTRTVALLSCLHSFLLCGQSKQMDKTRTSQEKAAPLTVCQVLKSKGKLRKRTIVVSDRWTAGYHGVSLWPRSPGLCPGFERKGWEIGIHVITPEDSRASHVTQRDRESYERSRRTLDVKTEPGTAIIATVEGVLESKRIHWIHRHSDGPVAATGYGMGGFFPAQLILTRVLDVQVVKDQLPNPD
jgi:hypothetical protein